MRITLNASLTADLTRRTLTGTVCHFGDEVGHTSAGPLRVAATIPAPPVGLALTLEHDRSIVRGHVALVDANAERLRVVCRVVDGPLGDAALAEASSPDRPRAGFSFDLEDVEVVDGVIVAATWAALGQVENPAFNSARIDNVAAASTLKETTAMNLTPEQAARLAELRAIPADELTPEQAAELAALVALEAGDDPQASAAAPAAASIPATAAAAVPAGIPAPVTASGFAVRETGAQRLARMCAEVAAGLSSGNRVAAITAALQDITHTAHTGNIEPFAWSDELWSGLEYVPEWSDLLTPDTLTHWEGKGWRFTSKLEIQDYAGDKTAIPTDNVTTVASSYEAARMAVGVDVDRKFYDFPNAGFVQSLLEQIRESWEMKIDVKARAHILTNARAASRTALVTTVSGDATVTAAAGTFTPLDVGAPISGTGIPVGATIVSVTSGAEVELSANATAAGAGVSVAIARTQDKLLKAAARASLVLKRRRVGAADFIVVNDEDMFTLLDLAEKDVPAFLDLYGIDPRNFRSSPDVAAGTVVAGVKKAAKLRTLPGSPIRVDAQNLAHGGVDSAAFGYWATETHHPDGFVTVRYRAAA